MEWTLLAQLYGDFPCGAGDFDGNYVGDVGFTYDATAIVASGPPDGPPEALLVLEARYVRAAGDLDGDGLFDVVAVGPDGEGYVVFGGPEPVEVRTLSMPVGEIARAGDVNGDGFADVIVAGPGGGLRAVQVIYGDPVALVEGPVWSVPAGDVAFGDALSWARDVDGDGFDDLLVAAVTAVGPVLRWYRGGPAGPDDVADRELPCRTTVPPLAAIGDFDGDLRDDFVVGAPDTDQRRGLVTLYLGGEDGPYAAGSWDGDAANTSFGLAVAGAGDIDSDGYDDVIIGSAVGPQTLGEGPYAYRALVLAGGDPAARRVIDDLGLADAGDAREMWVDVMVMSRGAYGQDGDMLLLGGGGHIGMFGREVEDGADTADELVDTAGSDDAAPCEAQTDIWNDGIDQNCDGVDAVGPSCAVVAPRATGAGASLLAVLGAALAARRRRT